jgi:SAM-dependent methyltransferase
MTCWPAGSQETAIIQREQKLRDWFTRGCDSIQKEVDGLDIGWGGVQRWVTARMPPLAEELHLDLACGYATFLAQLGWRFPGVRLVGLNIDFEGAHALARPLLQEAGVEAELVQADARRIPFGDNTFGSASCFLGLQDIEIGFGERGVLAAVAETVRVLRPEGVFSLVDEFSFEQFDALLGRLPVVVIDRAARALEVRWNREVAERAIGLYAEGWVAQARIIDRVAQQQARIEVYNQMEQEMERQLVTQGYYIPFGPVRLVVARKR